MQRAENAFKRLLAGRSGLSILVVFGVVFAGSVSRYLFSSPLQWSEEVAKYAMIYGCMFGVAYAYLPGTQITFSIVIDTVLARLRRKLAVVVDAAPLILGGVLASTGWILAAKPGWTFPSVLRIQWHCVYVACTLSAVALLLAAHCRPVS